MGALTALAALGALATLTAATASTALAAATALGSRAALLSLVLSAVPSAVRLARHVRLPIRGCPQVSA